jgi:hypothetical protein
MALHGNFDTIAVRVQFGASGCIRVRFVLVLHGKRKSNHADRNADKFIPCESLMVQ